MFETGIRQFRMAISMVWGRRIDTANLARLVDDARATLLEFGSPGADVQQLIDGPFTDPQAQLDLAVRGLRRSAGRLQTQSPFYARRFAAADVEPAKLTMEALRTIPVTTKRDVIDRPEEFRCADVAPHLTTRTTGTTGHPAEIWLSRYELELWSRLGALAAILRDEMRPTDVMQLNVSSRATASVQLNVEICRLAGAGCRVIGIVPPDEALVGLRAGATLLATCPSYLAELVVAARRRGLGPSDFTLRRIIATGEVLSTSVAQAARETFGVDQVEDPYAMTEIIPVTARRCSQAHLHHDINQGYVEVLDLDTGEPAQPGALGTLVVTPYFPYRECMPVFRYDTRDVVRVLPADERLTCELAGMPASSLVLGKADGILRLASGQVVTPRQLVEAAESLPSDPWPARFKAVVDGGRLQISLPAGAVHPQGPDATVQHFAEQGLTVDLVVVDEDEARLLRPLRCDLHETTFVARPAPVGD